MGIIGAILFMSINPLRWKNDLTKEELLPIILEQAIRFIVGGIWSYIGIYYVLIDATFSGFAIWWALPIFIAIVIDGFVIKNSYDIKNSETIGKIWLGLGILGCVIYIFMITIYPASTMKERYKFVKEFVTVTQSNIPDTDTNNIGIVSEKTAKRTGGMSLSNFDNSSMYKDGTYSKQIVNNDTKWVSPIEFESSVKAIGSDKKTPGYLIVDSNNPDENAVSVKSNYTYMSSAVFSRDLARLVHFKYPTKIVIDSWFELDDNGKGNCIVALGQKKFFRFLNVQDSIAIVNPDTGEMTKYNMDEIPEWVDIAFSSNLAEKYANIYGGNSKGFWARYFAASDQFKLTTWTWETENGNISGDDAWSIITDSNNNMWYTSDCENLNSSNKSIVGYIMISTKTGKITYYDKVRGVNGKAFGENAIQLFKEKVGWVPVEPTIYTIFEQITWYSTIVDENGQIQKYVLGKVSNGEIAYGDTFNGAINAYKKLLSADGLVTAPSASSESKKVTGLVERIIVGNPTKILIQNSDKIFVIENEVSPYAQFTVNGDNIEISYNDTNSTEVYAYEFFNKSLNK
jgi:hypothetical protein